MVRKKVSKREVMALKRQLLTERKKWAAVLGKRGAAGRKKVARLLARCERNLASKKRAA